MAKDFGHLIRHLSSLGCSQFFVKRLAPNDNSKNQLYLGGSFEVLQRLPSGDFAGEEKTGGGRIIKAPVAWHWLNEAGEENLAPATKLILYPQYPEVRLSGFLKGCKDSPRLMATRDEGRVLILGVDLVRQCSVAGVYPTEDNVARTCPFGSLEETDSALQQLPMSWISEPSLELVANDFLAEEAGADVGSFPGRIPQLVRTGWLDSSRLSQRGLLSYTAQNGVGYTLEGNLGITPNGYSAPDYLGWELKAVTVTSLGREPAPSKAISLMTPEPDGGVYTDSGLREFLERWGYWRGDKLRFTGRYRANEVWKKNGMRLVGPGSEDIEYFRGSVELVDAEGVVAASWSILKLLDHWKRKHARAAYLPAVKRTVAGQIQYRYGSEVYLGKGASILNFIESIRSGAVYYDPAPWIQEDGKFKKRSQFRVAFKDLSHLYNSFEKVNILDYQDPKEPDD